MAQEYTVEQLNHGRKVYDFMRWDYWAFAISGLLLVASIVVMGVRGFNWGLDFTGGTVIEIGPKTGGSGCNARVAGKSGL